jgi:hypothetical protein
MSTEQQKLPPKTCEIERLITVQADIQKVLDGKKTAQRRNGRYADIGEVFEAQGRRFKVVNVYQQSLGEMTDEDARAEGMENMEAYKNYILSLHQGMPWVPQMKVWVHELEEVK